LPIGVQLVGRFGDDAAVMALAAEYEQAQPWAGRWPAIARENASEKSTT
jgi:Asp-tRNA(Asn)/Glu-tRNA(Gln) amidotransferase A subunit family amidase